MLKSWRIQEKVRGIGFQWAKKEGYVKKMEEEFFELKNEIVNSNKNKMEEELGDFMFSIISFSYFLKLNPVDALEKANQKFINRFSKMEKLIKDKGDRIQDLNISEFERYWEKAKVL